MSSCACDAVHQQGIIGPWGAVVFLWAHPKAWQPGLPLPPRKGPVSPQHLAEGRGARGPLWGQRVAGGLALAACAAEGTRGHILPPASRLAVCGSPGGTAKGLVPGSLSSHWLEAPGQNPGVGRAPFPRAGRRTAPSSVSAWPHPSACLLLADLLSRDGSPPSPVTAQGFSSQRSHREVQDGFNSGTAPSPLQWHHLGTRPILRWS